MTPYCSKDPVVVKTYIETFLEQAELNARDWVQQWLDEGSADTFVEITDDDGNSIHEKDNISPVGSGERNLHLRRGPQAKRF